MKAGTVISTVVVCASSCFLAWRLSPLLERMDELDALLGVGAAGSLEGLLGEDEGVSPGVSGGSGLVVYSPEADELTEEERRRLVEAAARLRPMPPGEERRVGLPGHDAGGGVAEGGADPDAARLEAARALLERLGRDR